VKAELVLLLKHVFLYISRRKQINEVVSLKVMKDLLKQIETLITKEPLQIIFNALE
jgi:hypothetical protein